MREVDGLREALKVVPHAPWAIHRRYLAFVVPEGHRDRFIGGTIIEADKARYATTILAFRREERVLGPAIVLSVNLAPSLVLVADAAERYMDSSEGQDEIDAAKALRDALTSLRAAAQGAK